MRGKKRYLPWILVLLLVGGIASYFGAREVLRRRIEAWGSEGIAASMTGDHERAAELLSRFLRRCPDRIDALTAFIRSRELSVLPNGQHLAQTIDALKMLVRLDPDRLEDRRHLVELYSRVGRHHEALDAANDILSSPRFRNDVPTLELKTSILTRLGRFREADDVTDTWVKFDPGNLQAYMAHLSLRARLKEPTESLVAYANDLRKLHPGDARFEILQGFAYMQGQEPEITFQQKQLATQWIKTAAVHPDLPDNLILMVVAQLDALGLSNDSLDLLQSRVEKRAPAEIRHAFACRLWEQGKWDRVAKLLSDLDLKRPDADPTLIALKAIAVAALGNVGEARLCRDALASRKHPAAVAWTLILKRVIDSTPVDDKLLISECQSALLLDPQNSYLTYYLADALERLGEVDLATNAWRHTVGENSTWPEPAVRLVETLLHSNKIEEAIRFAQFSAQRNPGSASSLITLARAKAAGIETGVTSGSADDLLTVVAAMQGTLPRNELALMLRIQLAAHEGQNDDAVKFARMAIAANPPPSEAVFMAIAALSRRFNLGVESECFTSSEKVHGLTPVLAYAQAMDRSISAGPEEGLKLFSALSERSGKSEEMGWRLARARYLDATANAAAKSAWIAIGDAFPNDLSVQASASAAQSVRGEWDFMDRTINRLKQLTGDKGLVWRLAKARLLVETPRSTTDTEQGSVLLNEIIHEFPALSEPHLLLGRALVAMGRIDGAIEHLSIAEKLDPSSIPIALERAAVLQLHGDFKEVRQELERVAPRLLLPEQRRQAAFLLARQGEIDRATNILDSDQAGVLQGSEAIQPIVQGLLAALSDNNVADRADIKQHLDLLRLCVHDADVQSLVGSVVQDPLGSDLKLKLLQLIAEGRASHDIESLCVRLKQFAEKHPSFVQARIQLAQCYWQTGRQGEAFATAKQAIEAFSSDPGPAQFAVQLYGAAGSWQEMLAAAEEWKSRSNNGPLGPDLAIARAYFGLKRFDLAAKQIEPSVHTATAQADRYADLIFMYCFAVASSGQERHAADTLWPLTSKGPAWRARWFQVGVALPDARGALKWIERGAGIVPVDSLQERVIVAQAYDSLGRREKNPELIRRATKLFEEICSHPHVDALSLLLAGSQAEQNRDLTTAESLYRRALGKDPNMWIAQNNLALLLSSRGKNISEALAFASSAVKARPDEATVYDTLAQVQSKAGDFKAAAESIENAIRLEPHNSKWRARLAQIRAQH